MQALDQYQQAIDLCRGPYLGDDLYEEWTLPLRQQFQHQFVEALSHQATCHAHLRDYAQAIARCRQALLEAPAEESLYRQLMQYCYYAGERQSALESYEICLQALAERLGVEPNRQTRELAQQIKTEQLPVLRRAVPHNLPYPLSSFIGRKQHLADLGQQLQQARLITLTGIGGSGKTRLAIEVAHQQLQSFSDGVWFVELTGLSDPNLIAQTVADVLGVAAQADTPWIDLLKKDLQAQRLLLVLNNCEHLVEAVAVFAETLLESCPELRFLVACREALLLNGEVVHPVPPLCLPPRGDRVSLESLHQYEATALFLERTQSARASFVPNERNAVQIVQICRRLEGIPLAIELAAVRLKVLSLEEIFHRLQQRFRLLTQGARTALPRHQTLKAAIAWSYNLLSAQEQTFPTLRARRKVLPKGGRNRLYGRPFGPIRAAGFGLAIGGQIVAHRRGNTRF